MKTDEIYENILYPTLGSVYLAYVNNILYILLSLPLWVVGYSLLRSLVYYRKLLESHTKILNYFNRLQKFWNLPLRIFVQMKIIQATWELPEPSSICFKCPVPDPNKVSRTSTLPTLQWRRLSNSELWVDVTNEYYWIAMKAIKVMQRLSLDSMESMEWNLITVAILCQ